MPSRKGFGFKPFLGEHKVRPYEKCPFDGELVSVLTFSSGRAKP
jgi:hypothetical protein